MKKLFLIYLSLILFVCCKTNDDGNNYGMGPGGILYGLRTSISRESLIAGNNQEVFKIKLTAGNMNVCCPGFYISSWPENMSKITVKDENLSNELDNTGGPEQTIYLKSELPGNFFVSVGFCPSADKPTAYKITVDAWNWSNQIIDEISKEVYFE